MLNDKGVGVIVNIKYKRERVRVPPIYFLSPNADNVRALVEDYKDPKKLQYGVPVHLLFCGAVTTECMNILKNSTMGKYLKTFNEVYCDFLAVEKQVFSFNRPEALLNLNASKVPNARQEELERCAAQLVSVMCTLNED